MIKNKARYLNIVFAKYPTFYWHVFIGYYFKTITMQQAQKNTTPGPLKPDLKHDSMEYSAATEGDDILDADTETTDEIEAKEITAEELDLLEEDDIDEQAEALNVAETDSLADEDNFLTDATTGDELEELSNDADDEDDEEEIRR